MREEDVSAEQPQAQEDPWFSPAHALPRRAQAHRPSAGQGSRDPLGLIWRVRDPASFRALARGRRHRSGVLEVRTAVLGEPTEPPRVAYAVGKTVGGAVQRNLVRRRLRAVMRSQDLRGGRGYLVRVVDPAAVRVDIGTLDLTLSRILERFNHDEREC